MLEVFCPAKHHDDIEKNKKKLEKFGIKKDNKQPN